MKKNKFIPVIFILLILATSCSIVHNPAKKDLALSDTIAVNLSEKGLEFVIYFEKGEKHNHPTFVFWTEDINENYLQTLFITKSFATGIFGHAPLNDTIWGTEPGVAKRPAALPYWWHKSNKESIEITIPSPDQPYVDAYSGETPKGSFALKIKTNNITNNKFRLLMEINQPWDWNDFWTNNKFPDDNAYKTSCQPSLIYSVTIDPKSKIKEYYLNPIGHGHYSGKDGLLYTDLSTITTARHIINKVKVKLY
jgi:hypothetical protein